MHLPIRSLNTIGGIPNEKSKELIGVIVRIGYRAEQASKFQISILSYHVNKLGGTVPDGSKLTTARSSLPCFNLAGAPINGRPARTAVGTTHTVRVRGCGCPNDAG